MTGTATPEKPQKQLAPDWWLFLVTLILLGFGVVMVFNSSYALAAEVAYTGYDPTYFLKRQLVWAVVGLAGMFVAMKIPYWKWGGLAMPALVICILLLFAVFAIGNRAQGAQSWIGYGPIKIQPSEFTRLAMVLFLARYVSSHARKMRDLWGGVMPLIGGIAALVLLVEMQPDLGTAITILLTSLLIVFVGGARTKWIAAILLVFTLLGVGMALRHGTDGYRWKRMITFVNPSADSMGAGYQITHSMIALGTGGMTGVGFGESREKRLGNLPAQRTDFIFSIVGEEMGLVGTWGILLVFGVLAGRGFHIAIRTKNPFGALLAVGITGMISVQALVNIAVVTASLPATGVPLPFLSYGGSSLVSTLFGIGILLNVSMHPYYQERKPRRVVRETDDYDYDDVPLRSASRRTPAPAYTQPRPGDSRRGHPSRHRLHG